MAILLRLNQIAPSGQYKVSFGLDDVKRAVGQIDWRDVGRSAGSGAAFGGPAGFVGGTVYNHLPRGRRDLDERVVNRFVEDPVRNLRVVDAIDGPGGASWTFRPRLSPIAQEVARRPIQGALVGAGLGGFVGAHRSLQRQLRPGIPDTPSTELPAERVRPDLRNQLRRLREAVRQNPRTAAALGVTTGLGGLAGVGLARRGQS